MTEHLDDVASSKLMYPHSCS